MSNVERYDAPYAERRITFTLVRAKRRTLSITVTADGEVLVRAPESAAIGDVIARVSRRGAWIARAQSAIERNPLPTPPRRFEPGETHLFLGRQYRLSVRRALKEEVLIDGDRIILAMHRPSDSEKRQALLEAWYLEQARTVFAQRLDALFEPFAQLGHTKPPIQVMQLEKRWGSLTAAGTVILNRNLVRAPFSCIDYVIVHELCHLEQPNHGPSFHRLLARIMPDAPARKALLERVLA